MDHFLVCDICGQGISDTSAGMFYWHADKARAISGLVLAHKACDIGGVLAAEGAALTETAELDWLVEPLPLTSEPVTTLTRLASLAAGYEFDVTQLKRLLFVTCAVARRKERAQ